MMVGSSLQDDWAQTIVLVGKTGNGKSATGNSILGGKVFRSGCSLFDVTTTSEMKTTVFKDGMTLNVIDTPGLFDASVDNEFIAKEIISCINMAEDDIHAFIVVLSVRVRYSKGEEAAIASLVNLFGRKIYDYMIIVFTGGDELEYDDETLEDYLRHCPETLKETLSMCENRCVLFDNKTDDQNKRFNQVQKLISLLSMLSKSNGGKPYENEMFTELKKGSKELQEQVENFLVLKDTKQYIDQEISVPELMHEEQVAPEIKLTTLSLKRQLEEERVARVKVEQDAKDAQLKSDEKKRLLVEKLEMAVRRRQQLRRESPCRIL